MPSPTIVARPPHVPEDRVVDFDIFAPPGGKQDIYAAWKTLQAPGVPEVVWTPRNGGHWIATRTKQIIEVYSSHKRFSSHIFLLPRETGEAFSNIPLALNPPEHGPIRMVINPALSPQGVKHLEGMIRTIAGDLIEGFRLNGGCNFTTEFAEIFPLKIFMGLVNLPFADAPQLKRAVDELLRPTGEMDVSEGTQRLLNYMTTYINERKRKPGDDLLSIVANAELKGRPTTFEESVSIGVSLLAGGLDTVANISSFVLLFLAQSPSHRRQLIEDTFLIPAAVEELLRRFPVSTSTRVAREDLDFYGAPIKYDDMILAAGPLAGLDDQVYDDPFEVDFRRQNIRYATFGFGNHICVGAHLARLELKIMIEEWLARIPQFSPDPTVEVTYTSGHVFTVDHLNLVWDPASTIAVA